MKSSPSFDRQTLLLCAALILLVCAFYSPVIRNGFIGYDDGQYIVDNSYVKDGLKWTTIEWAFTSYEQANWHPLTWISHALDCSLFELNPAGHHAVNVLLHAFNAALLFLLLQSATGFRWRSLMVAALFALHPINVESVAWAAERKNVLSTFFFLLAFLAYDWYARKPRLSRYSAVFFLYALALLAKPQVITFPFLLMLWDYWPLRRIWSESPDAAFAAREDAAGIPVIRWVWEKLPLLLISAVSAVLTVQAQKAGGAVRDLEYYGLLLRVENALVAYVRYLGKAFWPAKLVVMYPHPTHLFPLWQPFAAALLLLAITVWVVLEKEKKYLAVGWFWFLGSLVPMIGLVQVGEQAMADRYAYISFIGLFVMVVWCIADWVREYQRSKQELSHRTNDWLSAQRLAIPCCVCVLVLGWLTSRQVRYWHDTEAFWLRTIALEKDDVVGHQNLANMLHNRGDDAEALKHVNAVLAVRPKDAVANLLLGDYDRERGDLQSAVDRYQVVALSAHATGPRFHAYNRMGDTYRQMGRTVQEKQAYESSLQVSRDQPDVMIQLGIIAQNQGNLAEAVRQYEHAVILHPSDVEYILLARTLQLEGRDKDALAILQKAAKLTTNLEESERRAAAMLAAK